MAQWHSRIVWPISWRRVTAAIAVAIAGTSVGAFGATQQLDAFGFGNYSSAGDLSRLSFLTGIANPRGDETRGFLVFDLTALPADALLTSALLRVENLASNDTSGAAALDMRLFVLPDTDAGNFGRSAGEGPNRGNFANIGGQGSMPAGRASIAPNNNVPSFVELTLNAAALADLNANRSDDFYVYGFSAMRADVQSPKPLQFAFGGGSQGAHLVVEYATSVPEPSTTLLMLGGLLALGFVAARRGKPR
jgi:PEP-CTERM motif